MKNRCYPKRNYIILFLVALGWAVFAPLSLLLLTDGRIALCVILMLAFLLLAIISLLAAFYNMQYYYFDKDEIVVKWLFGTIVRLNIHKVSVDVEKLPNYEDIRGGRLQDWICIYDESIANKYLYQFTKGCSNSRTFKRIQILYTKENERLIQKNMKVALYKCERRKNIV